jgi:hypothetical protein
MKNFQNTTLFSLIILFTLSCNQNKDKNAEASNQVKFFNHFKSLEGKKFSGKEIFIAEGKESWKELELEMFVREFHDTIIYIPFRVGDNKSRTWMVMLENGNKLRFRHDHRHEDGTPEDLNLYGGYASDDGTAFKQIFPADEFTCKMLERICDNEWIAEFSDDLSKFYYSLRKKGELIITIEFDLTKPID